MQWFKSKGIEKGNPEDIKDHHHGVNLQKFKSEGELDRTPSPSLVERRLKKRLTIST